MAPLNKIPLGDGLTLIVESATHFQPDLQADAHFAGIWPAENGPLAKKWIPAPTVRAAIDEARLWAHNWLASRAEDTNEGPGAPATPVPGRS